MDLGKDLVAAKWGSSESGRRRKHYRIPKQGRARSSMLGGNDGRSSTGR